MTTARIRDFLAVIRSCVTLLSDDDANRIAMICASAIDRELQKEVKL